MNIKTLPNPLPSLMRIGVHIWLEFWGGKAGADSEAWFWVRSGAWEGEYPPLTGGGVWS